MSDHDTTLLPPAPRPASTLPRRLALTLLCHPDPRRIGERAELDRSCDVSRRSPVFHNRAGVPIGPLDDPYISRTPIHIERTATGCVVSGPGSWSVDGRVGPQVDVRASALARGVVLRIADRALLLLHTLATPSSDESFGLAGGSDALEQVRRSIRQVAPSTTPVLIRGATGTGKELVARALHDASPRQAGPWLAVNMAAVHSGTAASALFGHAKGAFTGAASHRAGWFEDAHNGTLFLDEIGDAPLDVQATLLRVLESGQTQPVGGTPRRVDVRVVAATDADLDLAVAEGRFREPLLHRLRGWTIDIPPLSDRLDDIAVLFVHFLRAELHALDATHRLHATERGEPMWLSVSLFTALLNHSWPGNVRELRQVARRVVLANARAPTASVPFDVPPAQAPTKTAHADVLTALTAHQFALGPTAKSLGIAKNTLYSRMRALGIPRARDLSADVVQRALDVHGDVPAAAHALRVGERALRLHMSDLGITRS